MSHQLLGDLSSFYKVHSAQCRSFLLFECFLAREQGAPKAWFPGLSLAHLIQRISLHLSP